MVVEGVKKDLYRDTVQPFLYNVIRADAQDGTVGDIFGKNKELSGLYHKYLDGKGDTVTEGIELFATMFKQDREKEGTNPAYDLNRGEEPLISQPTDNKADLKDLYSQILSLLGIIKPESSAAPQAAQTSPLAQAFEPSVMQPNNLQGLNLNNLSIEELLLLLIALKLTKGEQLNQGGFKGMGAEEFGGVNMGDGSENAFFEALGGRESNGNYQARNRYGYLGKYQFGKAALQDIGYRDKNGNWTGKNGVNSEADFLKKTDAQENAMKEFTQLQWKRLKGLGADKYIGQTMGGINITKSGLLAAAHLGGPGNVIKFLKSGGQNVFKDGNNTPITEYMKKFGGFNLSSIA